MYLESATFTCCRDCTGHQLGIQCCCISAGCLHTGLAGAVLTFSRISQVEADHWILSGIIVVLFFLFLSFLPLRDYSLLIFMAYNSTTFLLDLRCYGTLVGCHTWLVDRFHWHAALMTRSVQNHLWHLLTLALGYYPHSDLVFLH